MKRVIIFAVIVLLVASCAKLPKGSGNSRFLIDLGKEFSYPVKAFSSIKNGKLHIGSGMAVAIATDGSRIILVTAKHIVDDAQSVTVSSLSNNSVQDVRADVEHLDEIEDIAFLSIKGSKRVWFPEIVRDENILVGKKINAFYRDLQGKHYESRGQVIDFWKLPGHQNIHMVAKMVIDVGYSGGGGFDDDGNLIGIISGQNIDESFKVAYLVSAPRMIGAMKRWFAKR